MTEAFPLISDFVLLVSDNMEMTCLFDPVAHDLEPGFRLTKFADLKG